MSTQNILCLSCYILDDDPMESFPITIDAEANVDELKAALKAKRPNAFRHLDVTRLHLWAVSIPIIGLSKMSVPPEGSQRLTNYRVKIQTLFPRIEDDDVHILIWAPPSPFILGCYIVGDAPQNIFLIKIDETKEVGELMSVIQAEKKDQLPDINFGNVELWAVAIQVNQQLPENAAKHISDGHKPLPWKERLSQVFLAPIPQDCIQILVRIQPAFSNLVTTPTTESIFTGRSKLYPNKLHQTPPSSLAKRLPFYNLQKTDDYYACCRPGDREPDLPLALLDPVFAKFVEESRTADLTSSDYDAAWSLREAMCKFYRDETERAEALREVLEGYKMVTVAGEVGESKCRTDGHMACGNRPMFIVEVKNELGVGGSDPSIQAMINYSLFCKEYRLWRDDRSYYPCFTMFVSGSLLGIGGCALTVRAAQEIFSVLPLNFLQSDDLAYDTLARHLSALKAGVNSLTVRYGTQPPASTRLVPAAPQLPRDHRYVYPYRTTFTSLLGPDKGQEVTFSYTGAVKAHTLIFTARSDKGPLWIKIARRYGRQVHHFCAQLGFAPKLLGFEVLPGGWFVVVMEHLGDTWVDLSHEVDLEASSRKDLKTNTESAITRLHEEGFVHGDIRDANVMVKRSGGSEVMLVDFDWAGRAGEVKYPKFVNKDPRIGRPKDVEDWTPILQEHDNHMFHSLFRN